MKSKNSFLNKEFWFQKTPEFFNVKFQLLTYLIDAIYLFYSILSIPLYIFYHIFGDLGIFLNKGEIESNPSLKDEFLNNYHLNDISLFWNLFNSLIPICLFFFTLNLIKVQTYSFYTIYMGILKLFIFAYLMNCNLTLIPHKSSFIYTIFNIMIIISYSLNSFYLIIYYLKNRNSSGKNNINDKDSKFDKYKININNQPASIDTLVHEVQIRMDMAKIKFNSIMVKLKLHKIFKRLLYQPKDFYFMSKDQEKEKQNEHIIRNIKGIKKITKISDTNSLNSDSISTTAASSVENNYSRLNDDEAEPLKM